MLERGEIDLGPLITDRISPEEAQLAYEIAEAGRGIKVVLVDDDS